jgi:hypothetical protein
VRIGKDDIGLDVTQDMQNPQSVAQQRTLSTWPEKATDSPRDAGSLAHVSDRSTTGECTQDVNISSTPFQITRQMHPLTLSTSQKQGAEDEEEFIFG